MARYLPELSVTSEQCRVSRPQFPQSTHGTPGTMTPVLARKTVAFYDSGFPMEARVINSLRRLVCRLIMSAAERLSEK